MNTRVQRFAPCRYQGGCTRGTNDPSNLCHKHRHLQKGYTRGGQLVFSSGGPLGAIPRLSRENTITPPQGDDSMEIEGFPYFSVSDQKKYVDWKIGIGARPSNSDVIDRFPIEVVDVTGANITGEEIGVYDTDGDLFLFLNNQSPSSSNKDVRIFDMENGDYFAIRPHEAYQVVVFDLEKLGTHLQ